LRACVFNSQIAKRAGFQARRCRDSDSPLMFTNHIDALIVFLMLWMPSGPAVAEFGVFYTKINSGETFEKFSRTGPHADRFVRDIGADSGRLVS